jgi:flavin-dependent dehydrogenase
MMREVNIAGGGMAGLALGLALRRSGVPVSIHEAGVYPRHRLCGEFLSGIGEREFEALGLNDLLAEAVVLQDVAWYFRDELILRERLPEPAYGISRWRLDAAMAEQLSAAGAAVHCNTRVQSPAIPDGWVLATGRPLVKEGPWYAEKEHYQDLEMAAGLEMHLGSGGYAGAAHIGNGTVNVCAMLPAAVGKLQNVSLAGRLRACGLYQFALRMEKARVIPGSRCGTSRFSTGWQPPDLESLRIGDNAAAIPPFTGHGMSMAVLAALESAPVLKRWAGGEGSWRDAVSIINAALHRRFRRRLRWAAWLHPFLLRPAGQLFLRLLLSTGANPSRWLYHRMR